MARKAKSQEELQLELNAVNQDLYKIGNVRSYRKGTDTRKTHAKLTKRRWYLITQLRKLKNTTINQIQIKP